ncbi:MAG: metal-dependent transcriptional regulator [Pirellulaceae bacterium]|nr:metal-dependent transcriptional regulator [Pirellulaceae bacterium]
MPSLTIENYVKAIYQLTVGPGSGSASTGALAANLRVTPSSVTSMLKTLHDSGLAEHKPYEGVRLTPEGNQLALRVLRRHRLIELFLARTLELTWDEVHDEAEHMEHAVSDLLVDRIDAYLGFPEIDPHGDPIPRSDGSFSLVTHTPLPQCSVGCQLKLERVLDQSSDFLRYLSEIGLTIGAVGWLLENNVVAETVRVEVAGASTTLGYNSAAKLLMGLVDRPRV